MLHFNGVATGAHTPQHWMAWTKREKEKGGGNINIERETGKGTWRWSILPYPLRISKQMPTTTTSPPPIPMTASVPSIAILIHVSSLQSVNTGKTARQWRLKIRWNASYVHIDTITKLNTKILLQFWLILNTHCFPEDKYSDKTYIALN